jgi:hypothetical protein
VSALCPIFLLDTLKIYKKQVKKTPFDQNISYNVSNKKGYKIMKKMFLVFSHTLTPAQEIDAQKSLGIETFVALPPKFQELWSNIPPYLRTLDNHLEPLKAYILENSSKDDVFLIQGDFGGCYEMVNFVKSNGMTALHSTTKRDVIEQIVNGKVEKFSRFEHVIFRQY